MEKLKKNIKSVPLPQIQMKQQPFFTQKGRDGFFSKSITTTNSFFSQATIQPKLTIGQPNDKYEVDADAMADKVVQRLSESTHQNVSTGLTGTGIQRKCSSCEEEEKLQKKEEELLVEFKNLLETHFNRPQHLLCAHNGKEFDFPYIARRMLINGISLPSKLDLFGKKPWEVAHLDTLELWKFGDYKHYTSLKLLTNILGIPSPKDDIDGSQVSEVYYKEKNLDRIVTYCEKDTVAVAQIILKLRQEALLLSSEITTV